MSAAALFLVAAASTSANAGRSSIDGTIQQVERMPWDQDVVQMAQSQGLSVVNVTWEDTGRFAILSIGATTIFVGLYFLLIVVFVAALGLGVGGGF